MLWFRLPRCLLPEFTWSQRTAIPLATEIPPTPRLTHWLIRRFWGIIHKRLRIFSRHYCHWLGAKYDIHIIPLPFGLILKWGDYLRLEEVLAMQVARAAGFPVPKVICYGDHPDHPWAPVSILMTRIPGQTLRDAYETMNDHEKESVLSELKTCMNTMRKWTSPWGHERICSITGGAIRSMRVPWLLVGPCESEQEFNEYLISYADLDMRDAEALLMKAKKIHSISHSVVFTHGKLRDNHIMVDKGHLTGVLDWESAGWQPDYWDFTTAVRWMLEDYPFYDFAMKLGTDKYLAELESELALYDLTNGSYYWG